MTRSELETLLREFQQGHHQLEDVVGRLEGWPSEDLGIATIDHARSARHGFPEVIFGASKSKEQVVTIARSLLARSPNVLITRTTFEVYEAIQHLSPAAQFHEAAQAISLRRDQTMRGKGLILVVCAGTSDIPVCEEAVVTCETMGNRVERLFDVGVAGIHRLFKAQDRLREARVVICVAGMEGALPSVVGGLVAVPVIAVPTSVGYGAAFGGLSALLGMLNSCASNVTVVNIDNGFGAGYVASMINRL